jgi:hypothetical protein
MNKKRLLTVMGGSKKTTYILQAPITTVTDSYIASYSVDADTNFGTNEYIFVGENISGTGLFYRGLIKFDLSTIPTNTRVYKARLSLWKNFDRSNSNALLNVHRLKRVWVENQVTYNIYSTGNNWQTAGGFGANDCEQTPIGSISVLAGSNAAAVDAVKVDIELDAVSIKNMINGTFSNNGFLLKNSVELNDMWGYMSSNGSTPEQLPTLTIVGY